jgi:hypothetical protein
MDAVDESFHLFNKLLHITTVGWVDNWFRGVSPRTEDQLRIAVG